MPNDRDHDRRKNPHERRTEHTVIWPHENCEEDCPVAIRNQEKIQTLFFHIDTLREGAKGTVKWKHFIWIVGGIMAIVGSVNAMVYDTYQREKTSMLEIIHDSQDAINKNMRRLDVMLVRVDNYMLQREEQMTQYRIDYNRLEHMLKEVHQDVKTLKACE